MRGSPRRRPGPTGTSMLSSGGREGRGALLRPLICNRTRNFARRSRVIRLDGLYRPVPTMKPDVPSSTISETELAAEGDDSWPARQVLDHDEIEGLAPRARGTYESGNS